VPVIRLCMGSPVLVYVPGWAAARKGEYSAGASNKREPTFYA
jgi:hypothetical protein